MNGHYFDLDQTQLAYQIGGEDICWISQKYTTKDGEFDDEKYFADFDMWWDGLSEYEKEQIVKQMYSIE